MEMTAEIVVVVHVLVMRCAVAALADDALGVRPLLRGHFRPLL